MQGYIKDFRKELENPVWMMPPLYHRIWQYLKYVVNHQDNTIPMRDGTFMTIKAGQHLTSVREIAKNVGWYEGVKWKEPNPKTVSTILDWLEKQSMIKIDRGKGNRQYTLITLINWELYQQQSVEGNSKVTDREHLADINKNDKECLKNDIATAAKDPHAPEESDGVLTTDQLGDSVPPEKISQTSEQAEKAILDRFVQLRARGFNFSPKDEMAAKEIIAGGVPLEDALVYLKECFDNFKPKHSRDRINSLSYCVGFILDKHQEKIDFQKIVKDPKTRSNKKSYQSKNRRSKPIRTELLPDWFEEDPYSDEQKQPETDPGVSEAHKKEMQDILNSIRSS